MLSLAHNCLLTLLKTQKCDTSEPVIMDQLYDVKKYYMLNKQEINRLKNRIKKAKNKIHSISSMKTVNIDFDTSDTIVIELSHELFDIFNWNIIRTKQHATWKEYFHSLYDLLVGNYGNDHPGNVILAREIVRYHDTLVVPDDLDYNDKMYPQVSNINDLFNKLKCEQIIISNSLKKVKHVLIEVQGLSTDIQRRIIDYQTEIRKFEYENKLYNDILTWAKTTV